MRIVQLCPTILRKTKIPLADDSRVCIVGVLGEALWSVNVWSSREVSDLYRGILRVFALLECYAAWVGSWLLTRFDPTCRCHHQGPKSPRNLVVGHWTFGTVLRFHFNGQADQSKKIVSWLPTFRHNIPVPSLGKLLVRYWRFDTTYRFHLQEIC